MSTIRKTPVAYVTMLHRQREPLIFISSIIYTLYAIRPISRVMSLSDHLSRPYVAIRLERPTWKHDGQPYRFLFGLASNGVYMCPACYQDGGSLLHYLSTLTPTSEAVYFCCTGLGVTSTGRYPASCPAKPGLSSSEPFRLFSRDHLAWLRKCYSSTFFFTCKQLFTH